MSNSTVSLYKAKVVTVISGTRNVTVSAPHLVNCDIPVLPWFDGAIKCSVPQVDDLVYVIDPLSSGTYRKYIPVEATFSSLTDTPDDIQMEAKKNQEDPTKDGSVWIEGKIIYLGADSDDWVAMSAKVNTELTRLKTELDGLKILLTQHKHEMPPGSGIFTKPDDITFNPFTPATPGSVASSKTKSES